MVDTKQFVADAAHLLEKHNLRFIEGAADFDAKAFGAFLVDYTLQLAKAWELVPKDE